MTGVTFDERRYAVTHRTTYEYGATMLDGYSVAHLLARAAPWQEVVTAVVRTLPRADEYDEHVDVFGNRVVQLGLHRPHTRLVVDARSEVVLRPVGPPRADPPWERAVSQLAALRDRQALEILPFVARSRFVDLAAHRAALFELGSASFTPQRPLAEATADLCRSIFETFAFDPSFTEVSTPLADVLGARRGVCQDFAHLAVGCLRVLGLAARYVSGYIETEPPPGEPKSVGADASHAWCSVWIPNHGWLDFDPTNGLVPPDRHVTVAWGRDYADVAPLRGIVIGPASQQALSVEVDVVRG
ncbi:MAG: transglutaminase family protein [Ilumatobacteraceae bacterium]